MKIPYTLIGLLVLSFAFGCKNYKSDHPQSELIDQPSSTSMNEKSIQAFSVLLDKSTTQMNKAYSLVYTSGDKSLYVERFSNAEGDQLYVERINSDLENSVTKYYFKKDSLILVYSTNIQNTEDGKVFKETKTFMRNYVIFKKAGRTATSAQAVQVQPYVSINDNTLQEDFHNKIKNLNDALQQKEQYDLVFDNVAIFPEASFITLKSKGKEAYQASIRLIEKDQFTDSLLNYPATFKDEKLSFKWKVNNQEAVYLPEGSTSTSANGLNR
jgi:hypothetical protein